MSDSPPPSEVSSPVVLGNVIGGLEAPAADGRTMPLVDPATGEAYGTAALSGPQDVATAMAAATAGFDVWRRTTPMERQRLLLAAADALEDRAADLVEAEIRNTGKPRRLTITDEVPPAIEEIRFFAGAARILAGASAGEYLTGHTSWVRREPVGVCAQVTPWNYPLMMAVWKFAPALAAGNTVVLKPSDTTPHSTVLAARILAGVLPPGVLNVVTGDRDTGRVMVAHPRADMVCLTGSVRAGAEVAASAAPDLKRVHLELGGKAPAVVFADADVEAAAAGIVQAGFYNGGQDCTAACRVLVAAPVAADLVAALVEQTSRVRTGGPEEPGITYGPVNNPGQLARVHGFLERLPGRARVEVGGAVLPGPGWYHEPTVVTGVAQHDEIVQEEVFGPVITVQTFADEAEALRRANDVRYGLAASVWTRDHARALRASAALDFGAVWINTHLPFVSEMPHGGFKHSGYGKDLSMHSLEDYTRVKHVMSAWG